MLRNFNYCDPLFWLAFSNTYALMMKGDKKFDIFTYT